jgi:hypothetical protein
LTACGFTAGGSGRVSSDVITSNTPSTQTIHQIDFIPTRAPIAYHNGLQRSWHYADRQLKRSRLVRHSVNYVVDGDADRQCAELFGILQDESANSHVALDDGEAARLWRSRPAIPSIGSKTAARPKVLISGLPATRPGHPPEFHVGRVHVENADSRTRDEACSSYTRPWARSPPRAFRKFTISSRGAAGTPSAVA